MPLHIRPATEADLAAICRVAAAAFDPATDAITRHLFPPDLQPDGWLEGDYQAAWRMVRKAASLADAAGGGRSVVMVAVDDDDNSEGEGEGDGGGKAGEVVVGFSVWGAPAPSSETETAAAKAKAKAPPVVLPPNVCEAAARHVRESAAAAAMVLFGEAGKDHVWYLDWLGVDPQRQRRGVGRLLLRWGMDRAASEGRDCYLVATPAGRPLYAAAGFEEVARLDLFGVAHPQMMAKNSPRWRR